MEKVTFAEGETVPQIFQSRVQLSGNKVALRYKKLGIWHDVTWNQYNEKVRGICLALLSLGLKHGECVSVIGDNCPEWVYIDLGTMHAGGVTVGVYATNSWEQCQYVVDHSNSRFYFVENEEQLDKALRFREKVPQLEKIIVWDLKSNRWLYTLKPPSEDPDRPVNLLEFSPDGTTLASISEGAR
ncbi:MAG: AMP-binding protein, partial [Deltaproteobacteria bacterium]|nr:AMP-binding protein [Deltaproteobacteria bacterium]